MTQQASVLVNRNLITSLSFPNSEVQMALIQKTKMASMLKTSAIIGRRYKDKVKITFSDSEGTKTIEEAVWEAGPDMVCLSGGVHIPFNRVISVELPF